MCRAMRAGAALGLLLAACSGGSDGGGRGDPGADTAGTDEGEVTADAGPDDAVSDPGAPDAVDTGAEADAPADPGGDAVSADAADAEAEADAAESPVISAPESIVAATEPGCDDCVLIVNDAWAGDPATVRVPTEGTYDQEIDGQLYKYRPWVRFRMPHPGMVRRLFFYDSGEAGSVELQLSTGFPGGHAPCLDEVTGEDRWPVGKPYRVETSAEPGWREVNVEAAGFEVGAYDEFYVIFRHGEGARVGLEYPVALPPGDFDSYGGLIADAPGDGMQCFSSQSYFTGVGDVPLVWLIRAEITASEQRETHTFADAGADGPNVGGHVAFGDYDGDGDEDFLSGGALWNNDGAGGFSNVTEGSGLAGAGGETVWGDYDNDGHRDVLAIGGDGKLFRNLGDGTFEDVTAAAGVSLATNTQGVSWLDADRDGWLDFYAASYGTKEDGEVATRDFFYRNNGDGTFTDATEAWGIPVSGTFYHGRGVCVADYDRDGDPDVYVGNYRLDPNQIWQNLAPEEGFHDDSFKAQVAGTWQSGAYGHTIGPSFGDLDGDGLFDILVPNLAHPRFLTVSDATMVYMNEGDGSFARFEAPARGLRYDETHSDSTLFDADNDGDLDLYLTAVYVGRRSYLYLNDGTGSFTDGTYAAGIRHYNGWGAAAADVDGDGDMDLIAHRLFVNELAAGSHYLKVRLRGGATPEATAGWSNRDAIGAEVEVQVAGRSLLRQVEGGKGVGCQNSSVLHFGLGSETEVATLLVRWPSGKTTEMTAVAADQTLVVQEE